MIIQLLNHEETCFRKHILKKWIVYLVQNKNVFIYKSKPGKYMFILFMALILVGV